MNEQFNALLDSGAAASFVSHATLRRLGLTVRGARNTMTLADGRWVDSIGTVSLLVTFGENTRPVTFSVLPELLYPCILGRDALRLFNVVLSFAASPNLSVVENTSFPISEKLTSRQKSDLMKLLMQYQHLFHDTSNPIPRTNLTEHSIRLQPNSTPFRSTPYRVPHSLRTEVASQIESMLEQGIIRPSKSPWSSPFFLVQKKNGRYRFVVDFRRLNSMTIKDAHPLPHQDDLQMSFEGARYFSTIDCASGYWQVPLEESSRELTIRILRYALWTV